MSWSNDFAWQSKYVPVIRRIVGPLLLSEAPMQVDQCEATDLIVLVARDMRIACRVRRPGFADRYPFEFTIRSKRDSGAQTEWRKLASGFGDWMFYGHAADDDDLIGIDRWMVIDLHAWREHLIRRPALMLEIAKPKSNGDGTHFVAYDVRQFPNDPAILVAASFVATQQEMAE